MRNRVYKIRLIILFTLVAHFALPETVSAQKMCARDYDGTPYCETALGLRYDVLDPLFNGHVFRCLRPAEHSSKKIDDCTIAIEEGRLTESERLRVLEERAAVLVDGGQHEAAISDYTRALEISGSADRYDLRARAHQKAGRLEAAIEDLGRALSADVRNYKRHLARGSVYRENGQFDQAIADLEGANRLKPNDKDVLFELGMAYFEDNNNLKVISIFSELIEIEPKEALHYQYRALAYALNSQFELSLQDLKYIVDIDPANATAWMMMGGAYLRIGSNKTWRSSTADYNSALSALNESIRLDDTIADSYYFRGLTHEKMDNKQAALGDFRRALELEPSHTSASEAVSRLE